MNSEALEMILLVEDSQSDAILTIRALRQGLIANPVEHISDGKTAIQYLMDESKRLPTLVMLDIKLNGHDGLWVLEQMQAQPATRLIPVMVFTHSDQQEDRIRSFGLGASVYVRKPVTAETLQQNIKSLGLYWSLTSTPPPEGFF
jgi:two-component system response regulator